MKRMNLTAFTLLGYFCQQTITAQAFHRSASNYGKYGFYKVRNPVTKLQNGANTIGLEISKSGHVMYDYLNLEIPDSPQP